MPVDGLIGLHGGSALLLVVVGKRKDLEAAQTQHLLMEELLALGKQLKNKTVSQVPVLVRITLKSRLLEYMVES